MLATIRELDLGNPGAIGLLRRIDRDWAGMAETEHTALLRDLCITVPPAETARPDIVLLPGGAVALRGPETGVLVPDPQACRVVTAPDISGLRARIAAAPGVLTLLRDESGVRTVPGLPEIMPPQAASILSNPDGLAGASPQDAAPATPWLLLWGEEGAVAWPFTPAPDCLALAATVCGAPLRPDAPLPPEMWQAGEGWERFRFLTLGIAEHLDALLAAEISDDLRYALIQACTDGETCLASRIADALGVLPSGFLGGATTRPGYQMLESWPEAAARLRAAPGQALLAIEPRGKGTPLIQGLRAALKGRGEAVLFREGGGAAPVSLGSDQAVFLARQAGAARRLCLLLKNSPDPADLYALAYGAAASTEASVLAAAPCWGFCHRLDPEGGEIGNASWFGLGPGLDELDALFAL